MLILGVGEKIRVFFLLILGVGEKIIMGKYMDEKEGMPSIYLNSLGEKSFIPEASNYAKVRVNL